jgi:hypothetical protein|tara:strand:- start:157 stop:303 length:147 start_codon:yes stop_codon:yes gene_type:complete
MIGFLWFDFTGLTVGSAGLYDARRGNDKGSRHDARPVPMRPVLTLSPD